MENIYCRRLGKGTLSIEFNSSVHVRRRRVTSESRPSHVRVVSESSPNHVWECEGWGSVRLLPARCLLILLLVLILIILNLIIIMIMVLMIVMVMIMIMVMIISGYLSACDARRL